MKRNKRIFDEFEHSCTFYLFEREKGKKNYEKNKRQKKMLMRILFNLICHNLIRIPILTILLLLKFTK